MLLLDTPLTFSMASHPQTDGMAELTIPTMEHLLYIHTYKTECVQRLPLVAILIYLIP